MDAVAFKPIVVSLDAAEDQFVMSMRQASSDSSSSRARFIHKGADLPVTSMVFYCTEPVSDVIFILF
jgi:hypothetical protein